MRDPELRTLDRIGKKKIAEWAEERDDVGVEVY